ncbi:MAG TPA: hypothetical protein QF694_03360 [Dehalococcoidia bacterium]|nr:hypothetical protein [Dehalococcoidia bacterium]|tara:strand:- start:6307 stop:6816 length:510 start_codon:yes stop_codon:yes gene_type:complete
MSSRQWGKVVFVIRTRGTQGRINERSEATFSREDDKIFEIGWGYPAEMKVERSLDCMIAVGPASNITSKQIVDSNFPDWPDPEYAQKRPEDHKILSDWRNFLIDSKLVGVFSNGGSMDYCCGGMVIWEDDIAEKICWEATHTVGHSYDDWGQIRINHMLLAGPDIGNRS